MNVIQLTIITQSPLAIGRKKPGGSVSEAENYIPGSVIRGAIANTLIQLTGEKPTPETKDDFYQLFIGEDAAIFSNAYPAPYLLPATAVSSKTNPGFKSENETQQDNPKNGVFDTLIDRFCAEAYHQPYDFNCPKDAERVEPFSAYYSLDSNGKYKTHKINKRLLTRTGINRRRATTEEDILYSIEVLNEKKSSSKSEQKLFSPYEYQSYIIIKDDNLLNLFAQFLNHRHLYIGGAKSRGLGKIILNAEITDWKIDLDQQIEKFNQRLKQRWEEWKIFGSPEQDLLTNNTYFTIDLQSDAILTENWQRTTIISEKMLQEFAEVEDSSLKLHTAYSSYDYISGWNAAWGLMKDLELITNQGGVYLYSTEKIDFWLAKLKKLIFKGVGERTQEGFGQIKICDNFHLIFRENTV